MLWVQMCNNLYFHNKWHLKEMVFIYLLKFYLFIHRDTEREAETQAEGEAGSMQRARHGTRSRVSRITPWAAGGAKLLRTTGAAQEMVFKLQ